MIPDERVELGRDRPFTCRALSPHARRRRLVAECEEEPAEPRVLLADALLSACRSLVVFPLRGNTATALLLRGHLHGDSASRRAWIRRRVRALVARQAVGPSFRRVPRGLRAGSQGLGTARAGVGSSQGQNLHGRDNGGEPRSLQPFATVTSAESDRWARAPSAGAAPVDARQPCPVVTGRPLTPLWAPVDGSVYRLYDRRHG